jgi:hypothetical protein
MNCNKCLTKLNNSTYVLQKRKKKLICPVCDFPKSLNQNEQRPRASTPSNPYATFNTNFYAGEVASLYGVMFVANEHIAQTIDNTIRENIVSCDSSFGVDPSASQNRRTPRTVEFRRINARDVASTDTLSVSDFDQAIETLERNR